MHELRMPSSLVDPVEDERDPGHEGGSEERGVALEALLDHGGRVHHRVGRGVPDPEITDLLRTPTQKVGFWSQLLLHNAVVPCLTPWMTMSISQSISRTCARGRKAM